MNTKLICLVVLFLFIGGWADVVVFVCLCLFVCFLFFVVVVFLGGIGECTLVSHTRDTDLNADMAHIKKNVGSKKDVSD